MKLYDYTCTQCGFKFRKQWGDLENPYCDACFGKLTGHIQPTEEKLYGVQDGYGGLR